MIHNPNIKLKKNKSINKLNLTVQGNKNSNGTTPILILEQDKQKNSNGATPYSITLSKTRSHSQIKHGPSKSCLASGINSPYLTSSPCAFFPPKKKITLKHALFTNSTPTKILSKKSLHLKYPSNILQNSLTNIADLKNDEYTKIHHQDILKIERKIKTLEKISESGILTFEIFGGYQLIFNEIISKDAIFGKILEKIKNVYED